MNYGFQSFSSATECTLSTSRILPVQFLKVCLVQNFILKLYSHLLYSSPLSVHRLAGDCQAYSADPASAPEEVSGTFLRTCKASLVAQSVKNLPAVQETWVQSLGWQDPLEEGTATHSSILAWRISWTEEPGGLQFMWSQRVGHDGTTKHCTARLPCHQLWDLVANFWTARKVPLDVLL